MYILLYVRVVGCVAVVAVYSTQYIECIIW